MDITASAITDKATHEILSKATELMGEYGIPKDIMATALERAAWRMKDDIMREYANVLVRPRKGGDTVDKGVQED